MKYLPRFFAFIVGVGALLGVVWLGYQTALDPSSKIVAAFGVASAIAAPIGFVLLSFAFRSADLITKLSRVPEIGKLMAHAQTQEEKIKLLETQRQQLAEIVRLEARRQSLLEHKATLEKTAVRTLEDLRATEEELLTLDVHIAENQDIAQELEAVRERLSARRRGDPMFTFGKTQVVISGGLFEGLPWGMLVYELLKLLSRLVSHFQGLFVRVRSPADKDASDVSPPKGNPHIRLPKQSIPAVDSLSEHPASEENQATDEDAAVQEASEALAPKVSTQTLNSKLTEQK